jgi:hypothetical protein
MVLTRDFKKTVVARVERDPEFAKALLAAIFDAVRKRLKVEINAHRVKLQKVA